MRKSENILCQDYLQKVYFDWWNSTHNSRQDRWSLRRYAATTYYPYKMAKAATQTDYVTVTPSITKFYLEIFNSSSYYYTCKTSIQV